MSAEANSQWKKSSHVSKNGGSVEVKITADAIMLRDSKNPEGPVLIYTQGEWDAFIGGAKDGEFDL